MGKKNCEKTVSTLKEKNKKKIKQSPSKTLEFSTEK